MAHSLSHEPTRSAHDDVKIGSELAFAAVFAVVLSAIALWPLWHGASPRWWLIAPAAALLLIGLAKPQWLKPLNVAWFKFGLLLSRIMTPVVMGIIFFLVVTPTALIMRARGADLLRLKRQPASRSYWIRRDGEPDPASMRKQF